MEKKKAGLSDAKSAFHIYKYPKGNFFFSRLKRGSTYQEYILTVKVEVFCIVGSHMPLKCTC